MTLQSLLYLTGFRGTGKTTVANELAQHFRVPAIDLDSRIEELAGKSIREIFADGGEEAFRELETNALRNLQTSAPQVVSLGGGAVLRRENRDWIQATGICVWLDADVATIVARLESDQTTRDRRPALTSLAFADEIRELLDARRPVYEQASQYRVETSGLSVQQVLDAIVANLA